MEAHITSNVHKLEGLEDRVKNLEGTLHALQTKVPDAHRITDNWLREIDPAVVRIKTHRGMAANQWEVKEAITPYLLSLGFGKNPQALEYSFENAAPGNRIFNLRFKGSNELALARRNQFLHERLNKETNKWWDFTIHGTKDRKIPLYTSIDQNGQMEATERGIRVLVRVFREIGCEDMAELRHEDVTYDRKQGTLYVWNIKLAKVEVRKGKAPFIVWKPLAAFRSIQLSATDAASLKDDIERRFNESFQRAAAAEDEEWEYP